MHAFMKGLSFSGKARALYMLGVQMALHSVTGISTERFSSGWCSAITREFSSLGQGKEKDFPPFSHRGTDTPVLVG